MIKNYLFILACTMSCMLCAMENQIEYDLEQQFITSLNAVIEDAQQVTNATSNKCLHTLELLYKVVNTDTNNNVLTRIIKKYPGVQQELEYVEHTIMTKEQNIQLLSHALEYSQSKNTSFWEEWRIAIAQDYAHYLDQNNILYFPALETTKSAIKNPHDNGGLFFVCNENFDDTEHAHALVTKVLLNTFLCQKTREHKRTELHHAPTLRRSKRRKKQKELLITHGNHKITIKLPT